MADSVMDIKFVYLFMNTNYLFNYFEYYEHRIVCFFPLCSYCLTLTTSTHPRSSLTQSVE